MNYFMVRNQKFNQDAAKAFFNELSTRLEYMAEDLSLETDDKHFQEMFDIIDELRKQANSHACNRILHEQDMQKFKDLPVSIKFETPDEVKF